MRAVLCVRVVHSLGEFPFNREKKGIVAGRLSICAVTRTYTIRSDRERYMRLSAIFSSIGEERRNSWRSPMGGRTDRQSAAFNPSAAPSGNPRSAGFD